MIAFAIIIGGLIGLVVCAIVVFSKVAFTFGGLSITLLLTAALIALIALAVAASRRAAVL